MTRADGTLHTDKNLKKRPVVFCCLDSREGFNGDGKHNDRQNRYTHGCHHATRLLDKCMHVEIQSRTC
jgi:hypothetical protein